MNTQNHREYTKKNYLKNGIKSEHQWSKNRLEYSVEKPALNESGREAKEKGF